MNSREIIRNHIFTHAESQGFAAPWLLLEYLTDLCTDRLTQVNIMPEDSWAESYLRLYDFTRAAAARDFGDSCLFFTAIQPRWCSRRGLSPDYLHCLGISAYYSYADYSGDPRYTQLGNWFYHLQRFLETAIRPNTKLELVDLSRFTDK
jgi:hypothetical protein